MDLQNKKKWKLIIIGLVALMVILMLSAWTYVLLMNSPQSHPLASYPWPIACSTKGCVTSQAWARQINLSEKFSTVTNSAKATPDEALTTTIRQFLLAHAFLKSPVTTADAQRYREEVLKLTDEPAIQEAFGLSLADYDRYVVLPFLQQEALRQARQINSTDELYQNLSKERFMFLFLWNFHWDEKAGTAVVN